MRIYKFFKDDAPKFHDAEFYKDRKVADHIHQAGHRERLFRTLADVEWVLNVDPESRTVSDYGCGNGGLLAEIGDRHIIDCWGYDLSPLAVEDAKRRVKAECIDFVNDFDKTVPGHIVVMSEVLEHLVDPFAFLEKLRGKSRWIVASVPAFETPQQHYEFHLWAFEPQAFMQTFINKGYEVVLHYVVPMVGTQFVVARNK